MPRILIVSAAADTHAQAVCWGLRQIGHEPVYWSWSTFPKRDTISYKIGPGAPARVEMDIDDAMQTGPFDVVWMRRLERPRPMPGAHPDDLKVIADESKVFLEGILPGLGHAGTRWVNDPIADQASERKPYQLAVAARLGFRIPDTLISNNPAEIRSFYAKHGGRIIHKAMGLPIWDNADGSRTSSRTSLLSDAHLAHDYPFRACPAIYQELLDKAYELRVTVMGKRVLAGVIDSQRDGATVDWRYEGGRGIDNLRSIQLEPDLERRCIALCRALGLSYGSIDLVALKQGEIVFLEVNCAGQFLFKEVADPEMPMLDSFCRFLAGDEAREFPQLRFEDFLQSDAMPALAAAYEEMAHEKRRQRAQKLAANK
ncbi:RimK family alpha-L-glutamate ligase [Pseudoduganella sp.]|uniref:ATP-grasp domain-containing protein n=1 Tax=Pseudoduganella sp. TaxID=1880898 RepID=UPI0035B41B60